MLLLLVDLRAFEDPVNWSIGVFAVGVIGAIGALVACGQVAKEKKILQTGETKFKIMLTESGIHASFPDQFLDANGLRRDSHFGDWLKAVWSGWMANNIPSLSELHNISSRRERRRTAARVATGTTGLLVIFGIAGTLWCIHPILDKFGNNGTAEGVVDAVARAAGAADMIHGLGRAFWPSLTALVMTLMVAFLRGIYVQSASHLGWELDSFAFNSLFGNFRLKMFAEELAELQVKLSQLVARMVERDRDTKTLLGALGQYTEQLVELMPGVIDATQTLSGTAQEFAGQAEALRSAIINQFGEKSALIKSVNSVVTSAETSRTAAMQLNGASNQLSGIVQSSSKAAAEAQARLEATVAAIPAALGASLAAGTRQSVDETNTALERTTKSINDAVAAMVNAKAAVNQAGQLAAAEVSKSATGIVGSVTKACEQVRGNLLAAFEKSTESAASKLAKQASDAAAQLRTEVAPVRTTAEGIDQSNKSLQQEVRNTLQKELAQFGDANVHILRSYDTKIDHTAQRLEDTQHKVSEAVAQIAQISDKMDRYRPFSARIGWQRLRRFFGFKP